ncbi:MAG: hypothetical protein A3F43_00695 [Gammaproteobacteria bacterium RIFCSPHIGHO2_12_FULL_42_10]|nr:MAG: hypothetical protein A3F43_00695 [Gammaproteobacteria bacterium RIFCSPHIGHO2_12_FULL_42_10]
MKVYLVGGAVRDKLLGLPVRERDWVVVGATEKEMKKQGYHRVGKEFPVFLHPRTKEEYALARMERKVKPGYQGFTFDISPIVTLADDLIRRDLTINAMAETSEGELIDPYHGRADLEAKILRHTSPAFGEDPVRILRVARFLARYAHLGFHIAPETVTLMQEMVKKGEVDALVPERVWKEFERALKEKNPENFFMVLEECHALPRLFPFIDTKGPGITALKAATLITKKSLIRFATLLHNVESPKETIPMLCLRYRTPRIYRELALLTALHHKTALNIKSLDATALLRFYTAIDIFRREERFRDFISATDAIANAYELNFNASWILECAKVIKSIDAKTLIAQGVSGNQVYARLQEERHNKLQAIMQEMA